MKRPLALLAATGLLLVALREAPAHPEAERSRAVEAAAVDSVVDLSIFPAQVSLDDAGDRAALVVQATLADGTTRDVTALAALTLADPGVATLDSSAVLAPLVDGRTTLRVTHGGRSQDVAVVVSGAGVARQVSFENDVLPVLTRAGCNTGSCHGTSRGKDGFHLSLFGYDPAGDHFRITRQQVGRRIDLAAPQESLLLLKATGAVRHTGGARLEPDGRLHRALVAWLAAGAPADAPDVARVERLELRPERSVLPEASSVSAQRLSVRAVYADGTDRDVTELTTLTTSDASVAALDSFAAVVAGRRGEAWITARFGEKVVAAQVLVVPPASGFVFPDATQEPEDHYVDRHVNAKLRRLRALPSTLADDATWLRRVTIDVTGQLPAPEEVEAFLADASPDKRARRVDALLARPAFVELWTMIWAERLMIRSKDDEVSPKAALRYAAWLEQQLAAGVPLDKMVRDLLTATGGSFDSPAVNFFLAEGDTKKLAENVAQVFLGIRLQCAQCHNHPFDRWTQDDYYGFAAFFARVGRKPGGDPRERLLFDRGGGELNHPVTGKPAAPRFLGGPALGPSKATRREDLARWLTAPENPWFARNVANMIWTHFLGVGIVHEPDDVRVSNPPSNPALLDALAGRLQATGYDFKALVRDICTSRAYQRSTAPAPGGAPGDRDYARAHVRRLRAEVLLDAIAQVTSVPNDFKGLARGGRAVEIADGATTNDFLTTFGRAARESVCACEVRISPNLGQALHLLNGDTVNRKIKQGKLVAKLLKETPDPAAVARTLYLRTLSRPPTEQELAAVLPMLAPGPGLVPALEDLLWALLNSGEFLFNH